MKKSLLSFLSTCLVSSALFTVQAHDFEVNKIYYDSIKGTSNCSVTFNLADKTGNKYASYAGDVVIPETVTYEGKTFTVTETGKYAFRNCVEMTSIKLPETIVTIGNASFSKCSKLKELTLPNSVTTIASMAFNDNPSLTKVILSNKLVDLGANAFLGVVAMKSIELPASLVKLQSGAFRNCLALESIMIPAGVTLIGNNAFQGCLALKNIEIDAANKDFSTVGGVLFNKDKTQLICYPGGRTDAEYTIPEGVKTIGFAAFNQRSISSLYTSDPVSNTYLKTINLPASVETLGNSAFEELVEMTSFVIPAGVTSIGNGTFRSCRKLEKAMIPDAVTKLDQYAYGNCESLKYVEIGTGMTNIAKNAFKNSDAIKQVAVKATTPPVCGAGAFTTAVTGTAKLQVPKGALEAYKAADEWKLFTNIEEVDFSGIETAAADKSYPVAIFNMQGMQIPEMQNGINIVKMSDGTICKISVRK